MRTVSIPGGGLALTLVLPLLASVVAVVSPGGRSHASAATAGPVAVARSSEPVILTGSQIPGWTRSAATGAGQPYPSGTPAGSGGDGRRTAHNGSLTVPPDQRSGVDPNQISAWQWTAGAWREVPVQVDQRFPYFLANGRSSFSIYSGTDQELTYSWAPDAHSIGAETWKQIFGGCAARYADPASLAADVAAAGDALTPGPQETPLDYTRAMADPVATLDDDDEVVVMARDAGPMAPAGTPPPASARAGGQTVTIIDPLDPANPRYVYLFLRPGGSSFTGANGYVQMTRDSNADEFIDRYSYAAASPEITGTDNTSYGDNIHGSVCRTDPANDSRNPHLGTADGVARPSVKRVPRDGVTVTTPTYRLQASGRWMVRGYQIVGPDGVHFGPNLISRWKGRAFQQSPDSTVSLVGFENEQTNWEANSAELGWKVGPVRAIREIWGADSGTNVTRTEFYYRDADVYQYHVRVHPIPSDGLYTSWDYRLGAVSTYYNDVQQNGVAIDGVNDNVGHVDRLPVSGQPAYFDTCDPHFDACSAVDRPEEVAGPHGGMVYEFEFTSPTSATNPLAVPYYRDDACLDDGTGDFATERPLPGRDSTQKSTSTQQYSDVQLAYAEIWRQRTGNQSLTPADLACDPANTDTNAPVYKKTPYQGAFGQHGIHFFFTHDSDNGTLPVPVDEIVGQQWRFAVPMTVATNVLNLYGPNVSAKLVAAVTPYDAAPAAPVPEAPVVLLTPLAGAGAALALRRRGAGSRPRP